MHNVTRRQCVSGGSAFLIGGATTLAHAAAPIRQGYQTNIWGMPTYYLLRSGLLEKRGIGVEEFAVPSGNLTMQQMVARQVDLGTFAGSPSSSAMIRAASLRSCRSKLSGKPRRSSRAKS
jgi:NitT/TauT family transport system substrate-binding protein